MKKHNGAEAIYTMLYFGWNSPLGFRDRPLWSNLLAVSSLNTAHMILQCKRKTIDLPQIFLIYIQIKFLLPVIVDI